MAVQKLRRMLIIVGPIQRGLTAGCQEPDGNTMLQATHNERVNKEALQYLRPESLSYALSRLGSACLGEAFIQV
jgi:hypothetical protein